MNKRLYLFSAVYPYNIYGDNFLEREMYYHFKEFEEVIIIPYRQETEKLKTLPRNCKVLPPILGEKKSFIFRSFFSFSGFRLLIPDFFKHKVFLNRRKFKVWVKAYSFLNNLCNRKDIRDIGKNITSDDVCYFYWGKWGNLLSVAWRGRSHFVSRFHGEWDLWEESSGGYTPLREKVAASLDFAAFISKKGENYFNNRYSTKRTLFAPLGSEDIGISKKSSDGIIRVFTCSNVIPLKRVDLIFECINKFAEKHKVEWTHIGGGTDFEKLKDIVENNHIRQLKPLLLGMQDHSVVIDFYRTQPVDLFMNLSTIEGVPVSIMEALSCNIPVVATNVGGVSEIVTEETGVLVTSNPTVEEVVNAMEKAIYGEYTPRIFWNAHYNADINYSWFAKELSKIVNT